MSTLLPLDDVRVIEIDSWMAAPSAAAILSDLGADVIKIEPRGARAVSCPCQDAAKSME